MVHAKLHDKHWLSELKVEPGQYLFHYTSLDSLALILRNGTLRLNTLDRMNDPREKKTWRTDGVTIPAGDLTLELLVEQEKILAEPDRLLRQAARVACFTRERHPHPDADEGSMFHRGWGRARMWHTYAREHRGVCLVFNAEVLGAAIADARPPTDGEITAFHPIVYRDRAVALPLTGSFETIEEIREALDALTLARSVEPGESPLQDILFTKNTDWASEDETRALIVLSPVEMDQNKADGEAPAPIDVPYKSSLRAIVFGEDCDPPLSIVNLAEQRGIEREDLVRVDWYAGEPILRIAIPDPPVQILP